MQQPMAWRHIVMITLPNYGQDIMRSPATAIIQMIYANYFGVPLELIAMINLIGGLFDAVTDPLVGVMSDRYYQNRHTRKPFMMGGMVLALFGMWFLYNPGDDTGAYRFLCFYLIYYLGWTVLEVPYLAWKAEVTHHYQSRTRIAAVDTIVSTLGITTFGLIPFILGSGEYTPETLKVTSWVVLAVLPPMVLIAVRMVPDGQALGLQTDLTLKASYTAVVHNRPYMQFLLLYVLTLLAYGMSAGVGLFYISNYLGMSKAVPLLTLYGTPVALISVPLWTVIIGRIDKHRSWAISTVALVLIPPLIDLSMNPDNATMALLVPLALLQIASFGGLNLACRAMLGDLIDFGKWKHGTDNGGVYVSVMTLAGKITLALSSSAGLLIASGFGFESGATGLDDSAAFGLRLAWAWIPLVLGLLAVPAILLYPLSKRRHGVVVSALERNTRRRTLLASEEQ